MSAEEKRLKDPYRKTHKVELYLTTIECVTVEIEDSELNGVVRPGEAATQIVWDRAVEALKERGSVLGEDKSPEIHSVDVSSSEVNWTIPTREEYVRNELIEDAADSDAYIATCREYALDNGWERIWLTPNSADGEGPCIVHWKTFTQEENVNDSVYDNWELLVWECGLMDIPEPQNKNPHLKRKENAKS